MISTYKPAAERIYCNGAVSFIEHIVSIMLSFRLFTAVIAQLGERKTEDLKVSGSIPDCGNFFPRPHVETWYHCLCKGFYPHVSS